MNKRMRPPPPIGDAMGRLCEMIIDAAVNGAAPSAIRPRSSAAHASTVNPVVRACAVALVICVAVVMGLSAAVLLKMPGAPSDPPQPVPAGAPRPRTCLVSPAFGSASSNPWAEW
jgi:hypothetical protein